METGRARRRDRCPARVTGLARDSRVLLQRRGAQIATWLSVQAASGRSSGAPVRVSGRRYHGDYIREIARVSSSGSAEARTSGGDALAVAECGRQDLDLQALASASTLLPGIIAVPRRPGGETVRALVDAGKAFERDGALWLKTTTTATTGSRHAQVRRRVHVLRPDVAYHLTKWSAGSRGRSHPGRRPPRT